MTTNKHIYTVSELTRDIKENLEEGFSNIWIEGEISNFVRHTSGHMYFSLKDKESVLSGVMYKYVNRSLKFEIKNGIQVICFGRVSVYERRGQYQFYAEKMEPKGVGALQLAFEQLKERLNKEGLFAPERKKPLPCFPRRIGVVTSPAGAAIRDILKVLKRRFSGLEIILNPVKVQGDGAGIEIARAIEEFNRFGGVDVLIVGRGGGSLEDLWAFNEEVVARAIYASAIPVISAVGHEIDYTISDFVADLRAPTPSAAAEQVVMRKQEIVDTIDDFIARARMNISNKIEILQHKLAVVRERYIFREPGDLILQYLQRIDEAAAMIRVKTEHCVEICSEKYKVLAGKLDVLSPLSILSRGYSITKRHSSGDVVINVKQILPGEVVETKLACGSFLSKVEEILD